MYKDWKPMVGARELEVVEIMENIQASNGGKHASMQLWQGNTVLEGLSKRHCMR